MNSRVLRDALIDRIYDKMATDESIFFLSADFGAPTLDKLREKYTDRFINVGIAEQNLIGISAGLALEGYTVYSYAIAPFLIMRAYDQIRTSISMLSQIREININLIGVGSGLSYDVTGPTHHSLEDSCIMNVLPNLTIFSPSDPILIEKFVDYTLENSGPKYIRLDGKAQPEIYSDTKDISFKDGFSELRQGRDVCIIATGFMTHIAIKTAELLSHKNIEAGIVDVYLLKPFNEEGVLDILKRYQHIATMEESFLNKGGLDSTIERICFANKLSKRITKLGFEDRYVFEVGNREHLYKVNKLDQETILNRIMSDLKES